MEGSIRGIELHPTNVPQAVRPRREGEGQPFDMERELARKRRDASEGRDAPAPPAGHAPREEHAIAPRAEDEVGGRLDLTA